MAIGAAAWGDHYQLPTLLVEMVFRSHGWKGTSLGSRLPADTLRAAIETMKPELFWLSVSHIDSPVRFVEEYGRLYDAVGPQTKIVIGGRALTPEIRQQLECACFCEKLADLEQFLVAECDAPAASAADA